MGGLLVRLAAPSCFRRDDGAPRSADDTDDVERALRAFALRPDKDVPSRIEAGLSVYTVDDVRDADDLVEERAAVANRDRDLKKVGHEDYLLLSEDLVVRAGLAVDDVKDPDAATPRRRDRAAPPVTGRRPPLVRTWRVFAGARDVAVVDASPAHGRSLRLCNHFKAATFMHGLPGM